MFSGLTANRRFLIGYSTAWVFWLCLHNLVLVRLGWPLRISLIDAAVNTFVLCIVSLAVSNILKYYRPAKNKPTTLVWWSLLIAGLCTAGVYWILNTIFKTEVAYLNFLKESLLIRFCIAFLLIGCVELISWVWYFAKEQKEIESRASDTLQLAKDAELATLRQQLQPHFLFNSLNSISALIGSKPEEARSMIHKLSDFFRGTLKKDEQMMVTLDEELTLLHLYLDIEKVRFGQRLRTEIIAEENTKAFLLPSMLLQPVVENAIKFGLYDTVGEVCIKITASTSENNLHIEISNPFDPQTASPRQGTGFGLASVNRRLHLLYGQQNLLQTNMKDNVFFTLITIPQIP